MMDIEIIRAKARARDYRFTTHALEECDAEDITRLEVHTVLLEGEILEQYGDRQDVRGDSCLLLGYGGGRPLHVVVAYFRQLDLLVVTAYLPKLPKWVDERTRRSE